MRSPIVWFMLSIGLLGALLSLRLLLSQGDLALSHWMLQLGLLASVSLTSLCFVLITLTVPGWHPRGRVIVLLLYLLALFTSLITGAMWGVVGHVISSQQLPFIEAMQYALWPLLIGAALTLALLMGALGYVVILRRAGTPHAPPRSTRAPANDPQLINPYQPPRADVALALALQPKQRLGKLFPLSHGCYSLLLLIVVTALALDGSDLTSPGGLFLLAYMIIPLLNNALLLWGSPVLRRIGLSVAALLLGGFISYQWMRVSEGATVPTPVLTFSVLIACSIIWSYALHRQLNRPD
ncbi:hypothetical protein [Pseudomonas sp.]|jgi:hypothetical protein|uniref:hypothetical protein n=1 Tax=Pseudomonas sp. TaxID=306 RepID=UPI0037CC6C8B